MDKYIFREYSPDYPKYFTQEKKRLEAASCDDRLFFRRKYGYSKEKRFVHIHLLRHGKQTWVEMIGLRDYLSRNQQVLTVQNYFKDTYENDRV